MLDSDTYLKIYQEDLTSQQALKEWRSEVVSMINECSSLSNHDYPLISEGVIQIKVVNPTTGHWMDIQEISKIYDAM